MTLKDTLTIKQEKFCLNLFQGMEQIDAYKAAGYAAGKSTTLSANASRLANKDIILHRLAELKARTASSKVMDVTERKERLSEIARARLTDYQTAGLDGSGYIEIGKESPNTAAISSIKTATKFDENGNTGTLFTEIKLHNPVMAIAELNKMGGDYAPIRTDITSKGNELKPSITYNVINPDTKILLGRLENGGRPIINGDIPQEPPKLSQSTDTPEPK